KLDTAFSRDGDQKVYVQHKMLENSKELFEWLQKGAYFFVCGDKEHMAKDVNEALITVIEKEGELSREDAESYLKDMQKQGRYQRDVY
ncbi:MAG TPA: protein CysJ, partial [Pseudoneobacillus sp.]|nr:protein CysJ [Pseudoneobacillus sp.]